MAPEHKLASNEFGRYLVHKVHEGLTHRPNFDCWCHPHVIDPNKSCAENTEAIERQEMIDLFVTSRGPH